MKAAEPVAPDDPEKAMRAAAPARASLVAPKPPSGDKTCTGDVRGPAALPGDRPAPPSTTVASTTKVRVKREPDLPHDRHDERRPPDACA